MSLVSTPSFAAALLDRGLLVADASPGCLEGGAARRAGGAAISASAASRSAATQRGAGRVASHRLFEPAPAGAEGWIRHALFPTLTGLAVGLAPEEWRYAAKRLAAISPEGATGRPLCLLVPPLRPTGAIRAATGRTQRLVKACDLPERICLQKRRNIISKTLAAAVFLPRARPRARADCGRLLRLRAVDLGLAGRACIVTGASRGIGARDGAPALRGGSVGAAGRALRGRAARGGRALPRGRAARRADRWPAT